MLGTPVIHLLEYLESSILLLDDGINVISPCIHHSELLLIYYLHFNHPNPSRLLSKKD